MGVYAAPLSVLFGEDTYLDGIDIEKEEFYEKLATADKLPTTSQVNPVDFETIFKEYLAAGDTIIGIFIGSKLSGTYQSAVIAKQQLDSPDNIILLDSKTATVALGAMVRTAVKMRDDGATANEIVDCLTDLISRSRIIIAPVTLKYLQMGGRISGATAAIAGVLNITPIVQVSDGVVTSAGKVRGKKNVIDFMINYIKESGCDESLPLAFTHSGAPDACEGLQKGVLAAGDYKAWDFHDQMGSVVTTHAGPGAYGVAYFVKQ